jgi:NitT/TauT family transport system ATP-binding protein
MTTGVGIEVRDARCRFRHVSGNTIDALAGVDVTIRPGEFVCLVGRSGHGKSTLLRAIAGLTPLSSGVVRVGGSEVRGPSVERSMVFQEDTVFPWMRVIENVAFGPKNKGFSNDKATDIARDWLERVNLADFAASWPRELSGGMRKRVAIATVFATEAPLLLMDEPFGALDYVTRLSLYGLLTDLWSRTGRTIVFVTHDIEEALILADRILVIKDGGIADDLRVSLPRPRDEDMRASPEAVAITKTITRHLGLADLLKIGIGETRE